MLRFAMITLALAMPLAAQVSSFDFTKLAEKAKSKTEVNMDRAAMEALKVKMEGKDMGPLSSVETVSVHAYEYAKAGDFPADALEPLRKQIAADKRWSKMVSTRDGDEATDIFIRSESGKLAGLLVIAQESKEVTVVEINGSVELAKLEEVVKSTIQYDLAAVQAQK
jgi:hypothetical protein